MSNAFFEKSGAILWVALGWFLVILAIYLALGRLLVSQLVYYGDPILQELNVRTPFNIEAESVDGEWRIFSPVIVLDNLQLGLPYHPETTLKLTQGRIGVDVWNSLWSGSLQVTDLVMDGLVLNGELTSEGQFRLRGFDFGDGEAGDWLQDFLLNAKRMRLRNNLLRVKTPGEEYREFDLNLTLSRTGSNRRVEAKLHSTRGADITVLASGLGNPFEPAQFRGDMYVDIQSTDIGAAKDLVASGEPAVWAEGELEIELWFSWNRGEPSVETRVEARNLLLAAREEEWEIPLQRVAFQARVQESRDHWTLYASELELEGNEALFYLPAFQLDAWGQAVRLRTEDIELAPMAAFAASFASTSETFRQLLEELDPRGTVSALQLNLSNFLDPGADWEAEANFESIALESYRGAPGTSSARGYVRMAPGVATVTIDSRDFDLRFPKIYHEPLEFDQLYGTLGVNWSADAVSLSSGLITAQAEEGTLKALFGLEIPLVPNEVGVEMELLVGLEDTSVEYREKYIPHVLNESLRNWLQDSIGQGRIAQGAFLWRGALKRDFPRRRTVQLAFNFEDTSLEYHPRWPSLTADSGVIVIDDGRVNAVADTARLLESTASNVLVRTTPAPDRRVVLSVNGVIQGPASDGLYVVNNSPLTEIVGGAFSDWTVSGGLETTLDLKLQLGSGAPPPDVDVGTRWQDVDLVIFPGNLPLDGVKGTFDYSTSSGFSSSGLEAKLWGRDAQLNLSQLHKHAQRGYEAGSSILAVSAQADVAMDDLREWLPLETLKLAQGQTAVDVGILVEPGEAPMLIVESDFQGVSLDLPEPWRKPVETEMDVVLNMSLAGGVQPIFLNVGKDLKLSLELNEGGGLRRGSLGIGAAAPTADVGAFLVSGNTPVIQGDQWLQFIGNYLSFNDVTAAATEEGEDALSPIPSTPADPNSPKLQTDEGALRVVVDDMTADRLYLQQQMLSDVSLGLSLEGPGLDISLISDWLRGNLSWRLDGQNSRLDVDYLDLSGLGHTAAEETDMGEEATEDAEEETAEEGDDREEQETLFDSLDLPFLDVVITDIYQDERRLGELSFTVSMDKSLLSAEKITGELAAIRLAPENPGTLRWQRGEEAYTQVDAGLAFDDFGSTLSHYGYEKIIETESGAIEVDLNWPGSPAEFALGATRGSIKLEAGSGSFLSASGGAAGALRVVSILNLVHIVQRLSVSHMFDSGIPFDSVDGEIYFHAGTIEVPAMRIKGGSSFLFSGLSDVPTQTLNGEMAATLPVAKNLPWVAALAASLPVAAGVYVVSKIFDKQVNRFSSAVYSVEGTWDEPQIKFDRIFDEASQVQVQFPESDPDEVVLPNTKAEVGIDPNQPPLPDQLLPGILDPNQPPSPDRELPVVIDPNQPRSPDRESSGTVDPNQPLVHVEYRDPDRLASSPLDQVYGADPNEVVLDAVGAGLD